LVSLSEEGLMGAMSLSLLALDFDFEDDVSLFDVLAFVFEMSVTVAHWLALAIAQPLSAEVVDEFALDVLESAV
jgi:hypothetical protein